MLTLIALIIYGVCAHAVDTRDSYKRTNDKKYAGSMLAEIAKEFIQRSTTSSQVKIKRYYISNFDAIIIFKIFFNDSANSWFDWQ